MQNNTPFPNDPTPSHDPGFSSEEAARDRDLVAQLAAADPVDRGSLPAADDPSAQAMLRSVVEAPAVADRAAPALAIAGSDRASAPRRSSLFDRGRGLMVAAAAAVVLLVGSVVVLAPDNTPSALAQVQSAASAAADAESGEIITEFRLDGEAADGSGTLGGRFEAIYDRSDVQFSLDLSQLSVAGGPGVTDTDGFDDAFGALVSDVRIVDGVLYIQPGGQWFAVDTDGFLGQFIDQYSDPRIVLDKVRELTEATEVGPAVVDGIEVTHFRSTVDLGDDTLSGSGWVGFDGADIGAEGEMVIDLYVDGDDALRRLELRGEVAEDTDAVDPGAGTFEVVTTFTQISDDVVIEAPEGAVDFDPAAVLGQEGIFDSLEN